MNIIEKQNSIIIKKSDDFDIDHIFECGQCFRWDKYEDNSYIGVVGNKVLIVKQTLDEIEFININKYEFENIFIYYFDLKRDYSKIKEIFEKDNVLKKAIDFGWGIRLLQQDLWECLMSFIISANNRIPMIKRTVQNISQAYGNEIFFKNKKYYSFPKPEQLMNCGIDDYIKCGAGFRAKYLKNAVDMVLSGEIEFERLKDMTTVDAKEELQKIPGIGPKVSDCILLFALNRYEVFPTDIWIKRVMEYFYSPDGKYRLSEIQEVAKELFGEFAGFAQQYLFYYARELKIGK